MSEQNPAVYNKNFAKKHHQTTSDGLIAKEERNNQEVLQHKDNDNSNAPKVRLDLNIEAELELKARARGDVTLTLLEN